MRAEPNALALLAPWCTSTVVAADSARTRVGKRGRGEGEEATGATAVDVARSLDGSPLEVDWLSRVLGQGPLARYSAPEGGAFRGMTSNVCRLLMMLNCMPTIPTSSPTQV